MPIAPKLEVPSDWPGFPLAQALERYLWLDEVTPMRTFGRGEQLRWHQIQGIVKLGLTTGPDGEVCQGEFAPVLEPASQEESYVQAYKIRESLMGWANTAILAAEDEGYRHVWHPHIEVDGEVRTHHREPGKPDLLICRVVVRMWLTESR